MALLRRLLGVLVTLIIVAVAALIGWRFWIYYTLTPWTRDARVLAYVVEIAPDVSGLISAINVVDNQVVHKGDVLFVIDQERFKVAVDQAQAVVLKGKVEGHSRAIADPTAAGGLLAAVNPEFEWIRLAQRIPVRIHLEEVPASVRLVSGLSCTVVIKPRPGAVPGMP